jgi:hypothetical protein
MAKDSSWHYSIDGNFLITLNTFSDNWTGSSAGSIIWVSKLNGIWKRQLTDWILSENNLKLSFGQTRVQDKKSKKWSSPEKSSDNINFLALLKFRFGGFIDPYASWSLNSQFLDDHLDSHIIYINPLEITESFGLARDLIKMENVLWNFRLGSALRQKIDMNHLYTGDSIRPGYFGTEIINDGGAELVSEFRFRNKNFLKFSIKLRLYQAFISTIALKSSLNDFWRYPDINLESYVNLNITKNILFNYYINVVYERENGADLKIKQSMGAGLGINFSSRQKK